MDISTNNKKDEAFEKLCKLQYLLKDELISDEQCNIYK